MGLHLPALEGEGKGRVVMVGSWRLHCMNHEVAVLADILVADREATVVQRWDGSWVETIGGRD